MYEEIDPKIEYMAVDQLRLEEFISSRVEKVLINVLQSDPHFLQPS